MVSVFCITLDTENTKSDIALCIFLRQKMVLSFDGKHAETVADAFLVECP